MTTQDGDEAATPEGTGSHEAAPRADAEGQEAATPNYPGKRPTQPRKWWRRALGTAQQTLDARIKPPANFGFPPEPHREPGDGYPDADISPQSNPIAFGFLFTVGVGLALLGFFLLTNVGSLVIWIAIALFIALGLDPMVRFLVAHGLSRAIGVLITMLALLGGVAGFIGAIIPTLTEQTAQFIERAPRIVDDFLKSEFFVTLDAQYQLSDRISQEIGKFFSDTGAVGGIFGGVLGVGTVIAQGMFGVLIVLVLAIYFLASLPAMKSFAYRLAPHSRRVRVEELGNTITHSVGNYVMGQAFVAVLNATIALVLMSILGVPFAALLTLLVAMLAFIPLVGAVIAGILVSLVALTLGWQTAAIYAVCYFGYLQIEAYFVSPRVMQKAVSVPGAVAVISVIAGGSLLGVIGALMAIPVAAAVMLILREVFIVRQDNR
ncbi:AI-2E family transporter [Paeniglutamicibacter sulfureus]|uniref:AI-2E family transporter n=1 Tax=Paeniglutamicibacter sulfureus TaxID=43666 RepID=UPI002666C914|nr:AI-2E family transporter [Paeniglutamicibacter sulfureus]MDO2935818.1 AI-2E family transporter [Paeniglutamicibacter sulfureus]